MLVSRSAFIETELSAVSRAKHSRGISFAKAVLSFGVFAHKIPNGTEYSQFLGIAFNVGCTFAQSRVVRKMPFVVSDWL